MANKKKKGGHRQPGQKSPARKAPAKKAAAAGAEGVAAVAGDPAAPKPKKPTQAERIEAARVERARRSARTRFAVVGAVVLVVALVAGFMVNNRRNAANTEDALESLGCAFDRRADDTDAAPNNHVAPAVYEINPPAGGNHAPSAARAGIYPGEGDPPDAQIVHALEHGYIALWYNPSASTAEIEKMRTFAQDRARDVLMMPRGGMDQAFAATAWGERLLCPSFVEASFEKFFDTYVNEGPEKVPH